MAEDETMSPSETQRLADMWREVRVWPVRSQLTLASRILQTVEQTMAEDEQHAASRSQALLDLIGLLKTGTPPNDADVDRILEEERLRKYG
jgi:hypothetical protein